MPADPIILSSRRAILLVSISRYENFVRDFQQDRDLVEVEARITKFERLSLDLEKLQQQLEDEAATEEEIRQNAALRADFEPRLIRVEAELKAKRPPQGSQVNATSSSLAGIKLPTIALPQFHGDYMEWLTFRDTFECLIHNNRDLPAIQKFHYLRAAVKGEAAQVIEAVTISAANYEIAWQALTARYSNEYLLKKRHLQALFSMTPAKRESSTALHLLVDEFERHKKTLDHLGEKTETWGILLEHLLCTKLPTNTLRDWEEHASSEESPTYASLIVFLQRRMRVLETLSVNKEQDNVFNESHQPTKRMPLTRLGSFAAASNAARKCALCDSEHPIAKCSRFIAMSPAERHRTVMTARLCLNCLRDNHRVRDCSSQYKCRHCNSLHHTMLHSHTTHTHTSQDHSAGTFSTAMPAASIGPAANDHTANLQRTFVAAMKRAPTQVLLQTAIIHIVDAFGLIHPARALLDSASQPDMISSQLAQRLRLKRTKVNVMLQGAGQSIRPLKESVHAKIASRTKPFEVGVEFLIVDKLISNLPLQDVNTAGWNIPSDLILADPEFFKSSAIDVILGARHYAAFFEGSAQLKLAPTLPTLQESVFGWVVTGSIESPAPADDTNYAHTTTVVCMISLEESIERFWKSEELWINDGYSLEERQCESIYKNTTQRDPSGRYIVRLPKQPDEKIKALGIAWEPEADVLSFESRIGADASYPTMRLILSGISRMFDPIGLISPIIIRAKLLMQELWVQKPGWDNPVSEGIYKKWKSIKSDWPIISGYKSDRYALLPDSRVELHTFCDASEAAFGACIYSRCEDKHGRVRMTLLASKSRLAPLKRITLPRLELNAAVTGAHLYDRVKRALRLDSAEAYFWSDSTVTLHWLRSPPNNWKTYIGNRVAEIQALTNHHPWKHIAGCSNPADLVSRGVTAADFIKSAVWRCGPGWVIRPASEWPNSAPTLEDGIELEIRQVSAAVTVSETVHPWFERYSSYTRLLRVIGYCLRFVRNAKEKHRTRREPSEPPASSCITPDLMESAKTVLCKLAQQDAFSTEYNQLRKGQAIAKRSPLRRLNPFLDPEGIMRVGGRLKLSQLPYQAKHPILLPKKHIFARRIAEHFHRDLVHGGGRLLLSQIREEYWPLDGRHLVKGVVRHCLRCIRQQPTLEQQQIGQLPASRITPNRPFSIIGVDYAGPIYLRPIHKRAAPGKAYLCVFVCFATKAVHLELVGDLTTAGFLAALRRFSSRRGRPAHIYSDNGKNFEGAARELTELFEMLQDEKQHGIVISSCADMGITWHFSPPRAPHFGGLWEAAVKTAKRHLFRQLGSTRLPYEGYITVLHQIEAAMNSRPLLPMSDDPNELAALTPAYFLIGTSMNTIPEPDYATRKAYTLSEWQKWQLLVQRFWKHWATEYLQEMQRDTMRTCSNTDCLPGRLVILLDEALPATQWPLARIIEVHPGTDKLTRVVTLRTTKGISVRPITKICLLPEAEARAD